MRKKTFRGIVDLVTNKAIVWHEDNFGSTFDEVPIPEDMLADVEKYRAELIEAVAEYDEDLLEKFFEDPDSSVLTKFTRPCVLLLKT